MGFVIISPKMAPCYLNVGVNPPLQELQESNTTFSEHKTIGCGCVTVGGSGERLW